MPICASSVLPWPARALKAVAGAMRDPLTHLASPHTYYQHGLSVRQPLQLEREHYLWLAMPRLVRDATGLGYYAY